MVAIALHGVAHTDDVGAQAFARHLAAAAQARGLDGRPVVAGMRAFLEGKPELAPPPPWSRPDGPPPPATGDRAVELLAAAAGCPQAQIAAARRASRHDLAGTAWILDPADGLDELVGVLTGRAQVVLVADPDDPATGPVLDALELAGRFAVVDPAGLQNALTGRRALLVDAAWAPVLAAGAAAGHTTALVDRFSSGQGGPDLRAGDLSALRPGILAWLEGPAAGPATGPRRMNR